MIYLLTIEQALLGLVVAVPGTAVSYWAYRRGSRVDAVAEQAGIATRDTASIQQVVDGLNTLVGNLQEDNLVLRGKVLALEESLARIIADCEALRAQVHALSEQIRTTTGGTP